MSSFLIAQGHDNIENAKRLKDFDPTGCSFLWFKQSESASYLTWNRFAGRQLDGDRRFVTFGLPSGNLSFKYMSHNEYTTMRTICPNEDTLATVKWWSEDNGWKWYNATMQWPESIQNSIGEYVEVVFTFIDMIEIVI